VTFEEKKAFVLKYFLDVYHVQLNPSHPELTDKKIEEYYADVHKLAQFERENKEKAQKVIKPYLVAKDDSTLH
jgi:hypothetical protein